MKHTFLGVLAVVFLLLILLAVLFLVPRLFLSSSSFRQVVIEETRRQTGFYGEWMPFYLKGWTLTSKGFEGSRHLEGNKLHVRIDEIRVVLNWRGLLSRRWEIDEILIKKLRLDVTDADPSAQPQADFNASATLKAAGPMAGFLPTKVHIAQARIQNAEIVFKLPSGGNISLNELAVKARPMAGSPEGTWSASLTKGSLRLPERPPWSLNSARLEWESGDLSLRGSEWFGADAGILRISGRLFRRSNFDAALELKAVGVPLKSISSERWRPFLRGNLDSEARLVATSGRIQLAGEGTGNGVTLVGVPALLSLQQATGLAKWTELPIDTAFTRFSYEGQKLELRSTVLESTDFLRTEGQLDIGPEKNLGGTFQVGLASQVVSKLPGAGTTVFTLDQNGYLWAVPPMQVSGTLDEPKEDLSPRLKEAVFKAVEEKVQEKVEQGMNLFDALFRSIQ